jgi:hypothetical protein
MCAISEGDYKKLCIEAGWNQPTQQQPNQTTTQPQTQPQQSSSPSGKAQNAQPQPSTANTTLEAIDETVVALPGGKLMDSTAAKLPPQNTGFNPNNMAPIAG